MKKIIILIMLMTVTAIGSGFSVSITGDSATVGYTHILSCDSIRAIFERPRGAAIDSFILYPRADDNDSTINSDTTALGMMGLVAGAYYLMFEIYDQDDNTIGAYGDGNHLREPEWFDTADDTVLSNPVKIAGSIDAADSLKKTVLGTLASYSDYHSDGDTNQVNIPDSASTDNIIDLALADYGVNTATPLDSGSTDNIIDLAMDDYKVAVKPSEWTTEDSAAYQGEAGSLTAQSIYDKFIDGSNEDEFKADFSGEGIYACTLFVLDEADSSAIYLCNIQAKGDGSETVAGSGVTNVNGEKVLTLNAGDYDYYLGVYAGYTFTDINNITITGNQTDTLWGTAVSSTAPNADLVTVKFWVQPTSGTADTFSTVVCKHRIVKSDSMEFNYFTDTILTFGTGINTVVVNNLFEYDTTATSYMEFYVYPNSDLSVPTSLYEFIVEHENGQIWKKIIAVPDTTTFNPFE